MNKTALGLLLGNVDPKCPISVLTPDIVGHVLREFLLPRVDLVMVYTDRRGDIYFRDDKNGLKRVGGPYKWEGATQTGCIAIFERGDRYYGVFRDNKSRVAVFDLIHPDIPVKFINQNDKPRLYDSPQMVDDSVYDDKGCEITIYKKHLYYSELVSFDDRPQFVTNPVGGCFPGFKNIEMRRIDEMTLIPRNDGLLCLVKENLEDGCPMHFKYDLYKGFLTNSHTKWLRVHEKDDRGVVVARLTRVAFTGIDLRVYTCDVSVSLYLRTVVDIRPISEFNVKCDWNDYKVYACADTNVVGIWNKRMSVVLVDAEFGPYRTYAINARNIAWLGLLKPN